MVKKRIIVGISGASGVMYGVRMLEALRDVGVETHLVMSKAAELTLSLETTLSPTDVRDRADVVHKVGDISASIASGSYPIDGMVIAPCSIKTLGEIASVTPSSLLTRAADVTLKERRRLVLMVRESPLHLGHLRAMTAATEAGAIICPPMPAFYAKPQTLDDLIDQSVGRAIALLGLTWACTAQWTGPHHDGQ
jgi:4-hydroxy-3-polyprenylbenzoate decarboxylase